MTSRESILQNIAKNKSSKTVPLPDVTKAPDKHWYGNLEEKYLAGIAGAGSKGFILNSAKGIAALVDELYGDAELRRVICTVEGVNLSNKGAVANATITDGSEVADPHDLADVDLAIVQGEFAVAENGAVWVPLPKGEHHHNHNHNHRALYYLPQHVIIVVSKANIVATMHEAYQRIDFSEAGYGVFIAGPSKTADIEQSLVIGAHGPMSTYVALV